MLAKEVVAAVVPSGDVARCLLMPSGMFFFAAHYTHAQYAVYVASASSACGFGRPGVSFQSLL